MVYLMQVIYYAVPVAAVVFFAASLWAYLAARKKNKQQPGSVSEEKLKWLKWQLVTASVIVSVLLIMVIGFMLLLFMAVAFM